MKKIIFWLPRVLVITFIAFLSLFALDVFDMPQWYLALFMHLIPSFILIILTVIAWKRPFVGGVLFLIAGVVGTIFFRTTICIPVFVIGLLFLTEVYLKKNKKSNKNKKIIS
jgi:hypothetical protein